MVLPSPARPRVSVVVLAFRHTRLLRRALAALARHRTGVDFETVIVVNGADEQVRRVVDDEVAGAVVVRSSVNLGFGGGCNRGVRASRGEFVVLLNDDTEVEDGWLDALVETADRHPEAGAVGSRVRDPYGTLQEAGGILWRDGSIWHVGRLVPDATMRYRAVRRVDYCSGCALLVRRSTWDAVGGIDERYFPGYYEDLDLCLSIAARGQTTLYQPRARLMHHGGGDTGSLDMRMKSFVARRSREQFLAKWSAQLAGFPAPPAATPPDPAAMPTVERAIERARHLPLRALVIDDRVSGEVVAVLEEIAGAAGSGYSVTLGAGGRLSDSDGVRDRLGDAGVDIVEHLERWLAGPLPFDVVVIAGRTLWSAWAGVVARTQPLAATVFWVTGEADARGVPGVEDGVVPDRIVCPSRRLADLCRADAVEVVEPRRPSRRPPAPGFAARRDVLAAGEGSRLAGLVDEVMPLVRETAPEARLLVTEGGAPPFVVPVTDADPPPRAVAATDLWGAVAGLTAGTPVVTTPEVAADLSADLAGAVAVAADSGSFAAELVTLLTNRQAWERARRAIDALPPPDPTVARRWTDVLDATRHSRLEGRPPA